MILYLDTETTSLYPGQICELSYIMQGESVTAKNFFFNVDRVDYGAFMVHGFSKETLFNLSKGKTFGDQIDEIEKDFLSSKVIVTHNTAFDFMFLREEFLRAGRVFTPNEEFCSMKKSVGVCKLPKSKGYGFKYPKLNELCNFLRISDSEIAEKTVELFGEKSSFHDSRFDTTALFLAVNKCEDKVFKDLLKKV